MSWLNGRFNGKSASLSVRKPLARSDELLVEEVAGEVLIYDQQTNQAHCLGTAAAKVWRACDGRTSPEQLGVELELDNATVGRALEELLACGLLDLGPNSGVTRREVTTRLAKWGAVGASAPLIWSIVGPIPEAAATATVSSCKLDALATNCGTNCSASADRHCCCCCSQGNNSPCVPSSSHCCYPTALCPANFGCAATAPCP